MSSTFYSPNVLRHLAFKRGRIWSNPIFCSKFCGYIIRCFLSVFLYRFCVQSYDNEKNNQKKRQNICSFENNPYLCTAFKTKSTDRLKYWRGGRVVDCGGLENRCTARYPGFESLSLRNKRCKSSGYEIYTFFIYRF